MNISHQSAGPDPPQLYGSSWEHGSWGRNKAKRGQVGLVWFRESPITPLLEQHGWARHVEPCHYITAQHTIAWPSVAWVSELKWPCYLFACLGICCRLWVPFHQVAGCTSTEILAQQAPVCSRWVPSPCSALAHDGMAAD